MTGTSVSLFEYSLNWLQREGWSIVSLDECLERLARNDRSRRYAVLTFDDGYRDNVSVALPILERHNTPFMMYVPTGATTRSMQSWWLGLRKLFLLREKVAIDAIGRQFDCSDIRSKLRAFAEVIRWVHQDYRRAEMLAPTFKQNGISLTALNDAYFLDERELSKSCASSARVDRWAHRLARCACDPGQLFGASRIGRQPQISRASTSIAYSARCVSIWHPRSMRRS